MKKYFRKFGEVSDCIVLRDKLTGLSRGYGFISMKDPRVTSQVINFHDHMLDGKKVTI